MNLWKNQIKSKPESTFGIKLFMCIYCSSVILCYVTSVIIFCAHLTEPSPLCLLFLHLPPSLGNFICKHTISTCPCTTNLQIYPCAPNLSPQPSLISGLVSLSFHVDDSLSTPAQCGRDRTFNLPQCMSSLLVPSLITADNLTTLLVTQAHNLCVIFDSDPFSGPHIQDMA